MTKTALPLFAETGGSIVNFGSVVSTTEPPTASIYAGTTGAVDTISKTLAKERGKGVSGIAGIAGAIRLIERT